MIIIPCETISKLPEILCPRCKLPVIIGDTVCTCEKGHKFPIRDNIIDFLPSMADDALEEEEKHWDHYAEQGKASIEPNSYIKSKILRDYETLFHTCIKNEWQDYSQKSIILAEIGCGYGSATRFLSEINFANVDYLGIDISLQSMLTHVNKPIKPNWKVRFVRASANNGLFKDNSLDIVFSTSALHHLSVSDVIEWSSRCLKQGGLLIMNEPSNMNPFAKLGRKLVKDFHTSGEKPLHPKKIKKIANDYNLHLSYEKGLHFLSGPMMYFVEFVRCPAPISVLAYFLSRAVDHLIVSPSWNYSFVQVYKRI